MTRGTYTEYSTLWPLIRFGSDPEKDRSMAHVLLFYRARKGQTSDTLFFPLWYHHGSPEKQRSHPCSCTGTSATGNRTKRGSRSSGSCPGRTSP